MKEILFAIWSQCGKRFKTNSDFKRHKRFVHLKERKFECNECQNRFFRRHHLKDHKRIHSGEKPYVFDHKNCGKRFAQKSGLNSHKRIVHLKEKNFECNECQTKFFAKTQLKYHKRIHSGEKPFVCYQKNCNKR